MAKASPTVVFSWKCNAERRALLSCRTPRQYELLADLKAAATPLDVKLPASIDEEQHRLVRQILRQRNSDVDSADTRCMVTEPEATRTALAEKSRNSLDPGVRSFSEKHLPVLTDQ